jgi:hypothetical protein
MSDKVDLASFMREVHDSPQERARIAEGQAMLDANIRQARRREAEKQADRESALDMLRRNVGQDAARTPAEIEQQAAERRMAEERTRRRAVRQLRKDRGRQ